MVTTSYFAKKKGIILFLVLCLFRCQYSVALQTFVPNNKSTPGTKQHCRIIEHVSNQTSTSAAFSNHNSKISNYVYCKNPKHWKRSLIAVICCILLLNSPIQRSSADATTAEERLLLSLPCPQSFSSQPLGIQNVSPSPTTIKLPKIQKSLFDSFCPTDKEFSQGSSVAQADESSSTIIQGLIYLPSEPKQKEETSLPSLSNTAQYLIIVISPKNHPDQILGGAKIPLMQIPSFPINFRIALENLDTKEELSILSKITGSGFQGRGISKMLFLPDVNGDLTSQRAATSIRLTQSDVPERLFTW